RTNTRLTTYLTRPRPYWDLRLRLLPDPHLAPTVRLQRRRLLMSGEYHPCWWTAGGQLLTQAYVDCQAPDHLKSFPWERFAGVLRSLARSKYCRVPDDST